MTIIVAVKDENGITVGADKRVTSEDMVLDEITSELAKGNSVKLSSFGTFTVRNKNPRVGRNPKTGVEAEICSRRVISFKPSQTMRLSINK